MKHQIKYALDVQTKTNVYERTVTQNDTIEFIITMLMGGEKMDLTNVTPSLAVKRLDGTVTLLDGTVDGNVITFNLGSSETAKPGRTQAVVQLYDANGRVSSLPFSFCVSADFTAAGFTPSENERTLIEVVLQDGPGVIDRATDAASLAERVAAQNETHPRGIYDTEAARDAAIPNPLHGDTATVANDSTGISTTYRYVDATVDDTVTKSGWVPTERLNNPSAIRQLNQQLAETDARKADKLEVQNELVGKRDKSTPITLNDADSELLAAIQGGAGTTFDLLSIPRDSSVTPEKTTFIRKNKNLFDKEAAIQGRLSTADGTIDTTNTGWVVSEPIPVKVGKQYKRSHLAEVVQYNANGNVLTALGANTSAFNAVSGVDYVRVGVRIGDINVFQLEEGSASTTYEPYGLSLQKVRGIISKEDSAKLTSEKIKTIQPYGEDYPDTIHELLPNDISGLVVTGAAVSYDYEHAWKGSARGVRLETSTATLASMRHTFSSPRSIVGVQVVGMWVYLPDVSKLDYVEVFVNDNGTSSTWTRNESAAGLKSGWNLIRWRATGGVMGDWNTFYAVTIRVNTKSATTVTFGSVFFEQTKKAKLLFVEDGGYVEFLQRGYPELKSRNIPTTWALNPGRLGQGRIITEQDVDSLALDYMSSFSFHSWASEVHATMPRDQVANNAIKCVRWLQKKGLKPEYMYRAAITQNNCPNHEVLQEIIEAYSSPVGAAALEVFPFAIPYGTPRITLHGKSPSDIDGYFDQMKKTHCLMIGYTHGVGVTNDTGMQLSTDMSQAEWDYFMQKIDTAISEGWLEGVTYDQLRRRYSKPSQGWGIQSLYEAN